jgi:hypothetical protein
MAIRVGTTAHQAGGIRVSSTEFTTFGFAETASMAAVETGQDVVNIFVVPPSDSQLYRIQWRDKATGTLVGEAAEFAETFYVMENLNPGTTYEWRVATLNSGFTGWVEFTTVPAIDGNVSVSFRNYSLTAPTATAVGVLNYPELNMSLGAQETGDDRFSATVELLMVSVWPETLPQKLLVDGYSQSAANTLLRSEMETGPAKQRRRFSAGTVPLSGKLILDWDELDILRAFYDTTLVGGSLRFIWKDPIDQLSGNAQMRFTSPITWTTYGAGLFSVSLNLEIMP